MAISPVLSPKVSRSIPIRRSAVNIEFAIGRTQNVRLAVFDLLGREVAVLVDGQQPAGAYRVTFDASDLASGMYLYQIRTDSGTFIRKMMLVK